MSITLWGRDTSANVQKVRWALGELGIAYEQVPLGGRYGGTQEPGYLKLNPNGLVPTLRDGELVLWESHAIVRYLAGRYGAGGLWPERVVERAECDRWTDWTATTFQPAWIDVFWKIYRTPEAQRDQNLIDLALAATRRCFAMLDEQLGGQRFLAGDSLTYADLVAGIPMFRWSLMGLDLDDYPNLGRWHAALRQRPAYRENVEVDLSELAGRTAF